MKALRNYRKIVPGIAGRQDEFFPHISGRVLLKWYNSDVTEIVSCLDSFQARPSS